MIQNDVWVRRNKINRLTSKISITSLILTFFKLVGPRYEVRCAVGDVPHIVKQYVSAIPCHRQLDTEVQVQHQARLHRIPDGQNSTVWGSCPSTLVFPRHTTPPMLHTHSPIYQHYHINSAILTNCLLLRGKSCHSLKCIWINHYHHHHHHHHH
jgi:hypothetical protein